MRRSPMIIAFAVCVGVISWGSFSKCKPGQLPWPPQIIAAGLVFAVLDLVSVASEQLANVMAVGFVLAVLVRDEFKPQCDHSQGTAQPAAYQMLYGGGTTTTLPPNQVQSD